MKDNIFISHSEIANNRKTFRVTLGCSMQKNDYLNLQETILLKIIAFK